MSDQLTSDQMFSVLLIYYRSQGKSAEAKHSQTGQPWTE